MTLLYLDFDYSEDTESTGVFDAMATVGPERLAALHAEIEEVLGWAHDAFPAQRGPVADGGTWDYDLQGTRETSSPEALEFDPAAKRLRVRPGEPGTTRHTVSFTIGGSADFCAALRERFGLD